MLTLWTVPRATAGDQFACVLDEGSNAVELFVFYFLLFASRRSRDDTLLDDGLRFSMHAALPHRNCMSCVSNKGSRQDRTGQGRTGQERTGEDRRGQERTGEDRRGEERRGETRDERRETRDKRQETRQETNAPVVRKMEKTDTTVTRVTVQHSGVYTFSHSQC